MIKETNALGESIVKKYDKNDNLILQIGPSLDPNIKKDDHMEFTPYDFANRLISQEEIHSTSEIFTTKYDYDLLGQCKKITNPYGQDTHQTFDEFGRIVKIEYPDVCNEKGEWETPIINKIYDVEQGIPSN